MRVCVRARHPDRQARHAGLQLHRGLDARRALAPASDESAVCVYLQNEQPFGVWTLVGTRLAASRLRNGNRFNCQWQLRGIQIAIGKCEPADIEPNSERQSRQQWHGDRLRTLARQRVDIDRLLVQRAEGRKQPQSLCRLQYNIVRP